jgi:cardiolipin synthase
MAWTKVEFLETGSAFFHSLQSSLAHAERSIFMEFYIFRFDSLGKEILWLLEKAKRRGVRVFLRVDGVGSADSLDELGKFAQSAGLEFEVYHPLPFTSARGHFGFQFVDSFFTRFRLINRRTHRKLVIIDERQAFSGGMNIDQRHSGTYSTKPWHDLSVKLEGSPIGELLHAFWFRPFGRFTFRYILVNYNWRLRKKRNSWFTKSIQQAKQRIWIITPYFTPTPALLYQLRKAQQRGVDIRLILSRDSDVFLSRMAALGLYRKVLNWGIQLYEIRNTILHRKLWVIDDIGVIGSTNFNHRSFLHDLELDVIFRDSDEQKKLVAMFLQDQAQATLVEEHQLGKIPMYKKFLSSIAGWISYWL